MLFTSIYSRVKIPLKSLKKNVPKMFSRKNRVRRHVYLTVFTFQNKLKYFVDISGSLVVASNKIVKYLK